MLAAAWRACLSAGLLGRSLPLIAMSLSLLGAAGGWGSEMTLWWQEPRGPRGAGGAGGAVRDAVRGAGGEHPNAPQKQL